MIPGGRPGVGQYTESTVIPPPPSAGTLPVLEVGLASCQWDVMQRRSEGHVTVSASAAASISPAWQLELVGMVAEHPLQVFSRALGAHSSSSFVVQPFTHQG